MSCAYFLRPAISSVSSNFFEWHGAGTGYRVPLFVVDKPNQLRLLMVQKSGTKSVQVAGCIPLFQRFSDQVFHKNGWKNL